MLEINIRLIDRMTNKYEKSLEDSGLFFPDQRETLTKAFRCGIMVLYQGVPEDY